MARQAYKVAPYMKHLEVFNDFSGGLNTVTTNDKLMNNELTDVTNMDLSDRGSLKRRKGMLEHLVINGETSTGYAQGYFRYYYNANNYHEIVAIAGKLAMNGIYQNIEGLPTGFQDTEPIEAVQFGKNMYFATGSGLVSYDGENFKVVEPYKPNPLEALYIGTNGLSDNPDQFIQDGIGNFYIEGATFSSRYGVVNEEFTLTAYATKPEIMNVEYQFEMIAPGGTTWVIVQARGASKSYTFKPSVTGDYQFRITGYLAGTTTTGEYIVPKYTVKSTVDPSDQIIGTSQLKKCNRILLHWGRLVLYGDVDNPDTVYFSHLNTPNYFPTTNNLQFSSPKREGLTALVQYRDMIVAFTDSSIQALYGKSPIDFRRVMLNTSVGCIAPYSAIVTGNYIMFVSREGVQRLKSIGYVDDKANVEKIDHKVNNTIPRYSDMGAVFHDGQYFLTSPLENRIYRYYVDLGAWTKDYSTRINFRRLFVFGRDLYGQALDSGNIFWYHDSADDDAGIPFTDSFETKSFDFGQPYHRKKLKELQVLVSPKEDNIAANVFVYADSALVLSPDESHAEVVNGEVIWKAQFNPNLVSYTGAIMGEWGMGENPFGEVDSAIQKLQVNGNCLRTKIKVENGRHVLGFAYVFKLRRN